MLLEVYSLNRFFNFIFKIKIGRKSSLTNIWFHLKCEEQNLILNLVKPIIAYYNHIFCASHESLFVMCKDQVCE